MKLDKNTLYIIIAVLVGLVGFYGYKLFVKKDKKDEAVAELEEELKDEPDYEPATFTNSEALAHANAIWGQLDSFWIDEDLIFEHLNQMQNSADWILLRKKFGNKVMSGNWSTSRDSGNLPQWLNDRLGSGELRDVSAILAKIGITF